MKFNCNSWPAKRTSNNIYVCQLHGDSLADKFNFTISVGFLLRPCVNAAHARRQSFQIVTRPERS